MPIPTIITGSCHHDERGTLSFVNDFVMTQVKRFYLISHPDCDIVRAWQGHQYEQKWFCVVEGSFKVVLVKPDDWLNPSTNLVPIEFTLSVNPLQVLHIPGGYANGFKALEPHSKLIVYSDSSLKESESDNFRFKSDYWFDWKKI